MKQMAASSALLPLLLLVLATVTVCSATGRRRLPYSSCRACCSGAPGTACPPWCPPCRSQCPAPVLTACPFVPGPRQRPCQDSDCPSGQRCCFNGCRVLCQSVCQRPCPPGQKCSLGCRRPPCPGFARCVPIRPTCKGFACPRGSHCVMSGGRPKCEPLSTRPGTCPVNDLLPRIFCLKDAEDECSTDNDCTRNQKCCSYGCVRTCVQTCRPACRSDENCVLRRPVGPCQGSGCLPPITTCQRKEPCGSVVNCHPGSRCVLRDGKSECETPLGKPGGCPINDLLPRIICMAGATDDCFGDSSCAGRQKCCNYGCARTCVPPCLPTCRSDQKCVLKRPSGPCLEGNCDAPVAMCELKNPCAVIKCGSGSRCVVRDGSARCEPFTTRPGTCPANDIVSICLEREDKCTSDAECNSGQKCCSRGCGRECVLACQSHCPSGQTCKISVLPCLNPPCPEDARCVANEPEPRPGVCPLNDVTTTCVVGDTACRSDEECRRGQKCCSRGCGKTCVPACPRGCPRGQTCKTFTPPCFVPPCPKEAGCFVN